MLPASTAQVQSDARPAHAVPRIQYPELSGFGARFAANEPAVIVGVPQHHALRIFRFTPESLEDSLGDRKFPIARSQDGFFAYERDTQDLPFREFVRLAFREPPIGVRYYFKNSVKLLPPGLDDSAQIRGLSRYFGPRSVMKNLWISRGEQTVGLHFDGADNFNVQLRGRKRFLLYPPGIEGYYPCPMFSPAAHISQVFRTSAVLDRARFPKFDETRVREVLLHEGEILYLPAYWWHQVTSLGEVNINLNTWSFPSLAKQLRHWNPALRTHFQLLARLVRFGDISKAPRRTPT